MLYRISYIIYDQHGQAPYEKARRPETSFGRGDDTSLLLLLLLSLSLCYLLWLLLSYDIMLRIIIIIITIIIITIIIMFIIIINIIIMVLLYLCVGDATVGNPRRAQVSQFELFELVWYLKTFAFWFVMTW